MMAIRPEVSGTVESQSSPIAAAKISTDADDGGVRTKIVMTMARPR